jgi:hypothetical protein
MSDKLLLIVDPAMHAPEIQGEATLLAGWTGRHVIVRPALRPEDLALLSGVGSFDGVVIGLGGLGTIISVASGYQTFHPLLFGPVRSISGFVLGIN